MRQRDIVAVDQPNRRQVVESEQAVFVLQVGEKGGLDRLRVEVQFHCHLGQDEIPPKPCSICGIGLVGRVQLAAMKRRCGKDLLAQDLGINLRDDLKRGAILKHLRQATVREGGHPFADQFVNLVLDFAASRTDPFAEDQKQTFRHLKPLRLVTVQILRNDSILDHRDTNKISCQHGE